MPLAQIIQGQLIEDSTNSIAWYICLNLNMIFRVKIMEDRSLEEHLPQFDKRELSSGGKKVRWSYRFFGLGKIFRFGRFWTFFSTSSTSTSSPSISLLSNPLLSNLLPSSLLLSFRALLSPPTLTTPSPGCVKNLIFPQVFNSKINNTAIRLNL